MSQKNFQEVTGICEEVENRTEGIIQRKRNKGVENMKETLRDMEYKMKISKICLMGQIQSIQEE